MASATERKRLSRRRKKLGKMLCRQVEVTDQEIDWLHRHGYSPRRGDQVSVSEAVSLSRHRRHGLVGAGYGPEA
jgi:hypothetical protein